MKRRLQHHVQLGFEVSTGKPVQIPIAHMCVTGMTQQAGKTTALEGLISRSGMRAITFVTKRGESAFAGGRRLPAYFHVDKFDWQYVESLIEARLGEKNRLLRAFLMKTCAGTKSLADVQRNVRAARASARGFPESIYTEIEGYLDLVVPALAQLPTVSTLVLGAGVNVMNLELYRYELQALVVRSVIERISEHESDVITVLPEAWEFLPEGRGSPVKDAAEGLIRKGAGLGNFMWVDTQDLAGVWKLAVRAAPVVLIGVQREANEIKRTLANIPAGVAKPKAADVAKLELGQFFACWGQHVVKAYAQPAWLDVGPAVAIAKGTLDPREIGGAHKPRPPAPAKRVIPLEVVGDADLVDQVERFVAKGRRAQQAVDAITEHLAVYGSGPTFGELAIGARFYHARPIVHMPGAHWPPPRGPLLKKTTARDYVWTEGSGGRGTAEEYYRVELEEDDNVMNEKQERKLDDVLKGIGELVKVLRAKGATVSGSVGVSVPSSGDGPVPRVRDVVTGPESEMPVEDFYQWIKARLIDDLPKDARVMEIVTSQPELRVKVKRETVTVDGETLSGRLARLIIDGFFDTNKTAYAAWQELGARGWKHDRRTVERAIADIAARTFLRREGREGYIVNPAMKRNVVEES